MGAGGEPGPHGALIAVHAGLWGSSAWRLPGSRLHGERSRGSLPVPQPGLGSREAASTAAVASVGSRPGPWPPLPLAHPQGRGMVFNNVAFWGLNRCNRGRGRAVGLLSPARPSSPGRHRQPSRLEDNLLLWVVLGVLKSRDLSLGFPSAQGSRGQEGGGPAAPMPHLMAGGGSPDPSGGSAGFPGLSRTHGAAAAARCWRQGALSRGCPGRGPARELRPGLRVPATAFVEATPRLSVAAGPQLSLGTEALGPVQIQGQAKALGESAPEVGLSVLTYGTGPLCSSSTTAALTWDHSVPPTPGGAPRPGDTCIDDSAHCTS